MATRTPLYKDFAAGEVKEFDTGDIANPGAVTNLGATVFTGLGDVPASYTGQTLKVVRVNAGETALEFAAPGGYTHPNHSGDVTSVGDGAQTIANDAVTNAKLANMAASTIKGNDAGGGDPLDLTATQVTAMLNVFTSVLKGLVPASGGGTANFLRADGTFAAPTASVSITETEIDLGTTPVQEASISVVDAGISAVSKILGGVAYLAPTGKDLDELEMDAIEIKFEPLAGTMNVHIKGLEGYLADTFKIWYTFS